MKVLSDTNTKVEIEFTKKEYYQIQNWLIGKEAGKIEIDVRDSLENFISLSSSMNPEDNPKEYLKSK